MKAKNKTEFEEAWREHVQHLTLLASSLPPHTSREFFEDVKKMKGWVGRAMDYTYGKTEGGVLPK